MTVSARIAGVGMHPFGRFADESAAELAQEAVRAALEDAELTWPDVQAAYCATMYLPATTGARILKPLGNTGIPISDVEAACASGGVALRQAVLGIRAGAFDVALVLGVEKMPAGFMDPSMIYERWQIEMGLSTNPSYWAMRARRHMHDHRTTEDQIAGIAVKNHRNSVHNPYSMYRTAFSLEEILASRLVNDPIRLLEICAPNEGAAAVVVCSERARVGRADGAVRIAASVHTLARYSADFRAPMSSLSATLTDVVPPTADAAGRAYEEAGIGPADVDCFEVQDTDAFCELEAYEHLGLCPIGGGGALIDSGATTIGGSRPVNMSGGLISKGEPVGASHLGQVVELVWQLRGQAGSRQVAGARVGLAHVLGAAGNCAVTVLAR
jgi:acetyl-CoA acetyltransferase